MSSLTVFHRPRRYMLRVSVRGRVGADLIFALPASSITPVQHLRVAENDHAPRTRDDCFSNSSFDLHNVFDTLANHHSLLECWYLFPTDARCRSVVQHIFLDIAVYVSSYNILCHSV